MTTPTLDDATLKALELGWNLAEVRGRNRPDAPPGSGDALPERSDHVLPLRYARSSAELRIQAQAVVIELTKDNGLGTRANGTTFGDSIDRQAKQLAHLRGATAADAFNKAHAILDRPATGAALPAGADPRVALALTSLRMDRERQERIVTGLEGHLDTAEQAFLEHAAEVLTPHPPGAKPAPAAQPSLVEDRGDLDLLVAATEGERLALAVLDDTITTLEHTNTAGTPDALRVCTDAIQAAQTALRTNAQGAWDELAELIYQFDAHLQDRLAATSETQACAYQLGRGLAETYWALDPDAPPASARSWQSLLDKNRCAELGRLVGRLSSGLNPYTPPAIAGSLEIWRDVIEYPTHWHSGTSPDRNALHLQTRRWYELLILGQDPTTLIQPNQIIKNWRTLGRAIRVFWPQFIALTVGLLALLAFLAFLTLDSGSDFQKTLSAILATAGLSIASLTGALKNSAQAMFTRIRQDGYTDLVAFAIQTAPEPLKKQYRRTAISSRDLTCATPN